MKRIRHDYWEQEIAVPVGDYMYYAPEPLPSKEQDGQLLLYLYGAWLPASSGDFEENSEPHK